MLHRRNLVALLGLVLGSMPAHASPDAMNDAVFWDLVQSAKESAGVHANARPAVLERLLVALPATDIQAFQARYEALLLEANRWDLWAAAYLMNGGCSDDCFKYFRDWLISEGRATFVAAIADPETLVEQDRRDFFELESFGYAAMRAFSAKGAGELHRSFEVELATPQGKEWTESELPALLPKLAAKYKPR